MNCILLRLSLAFDKHLISILENLNLISVNCIQFLRKNSSVIVNSVIVACYKILNKICNPTQNSFEGGGRIGFGWIKSPIEISCKCATDPLNPRLVAIH